TFEYRKRVRARSEAEARRLLSARQVRLVRDSQTSTVTLSEEGRGRIAGEVIVRVPASARSYVFETHDGDIQVMGVEGEVLLRSGGGRLRADRIAGSLTAKTAAGEIWLGRIDGPVR